MVGWAWPVLSRALRERHAGSDVLAFFKTLDRDVPRSLAIHVVLDNVSAHKAPEVTEWLARPRQARWHLHFTPTSSSWLNLIEGWFSKLTEKRLRRGSFISLEHLADAIHVWVEHWNQDPKPFTWTARPERHPQQKSNAHAQPSAITKPIPCQTTRARSAPYESPGRRPTEGCTPPPAVD